MIEQELREKIAKVIFHKIHPITDTFPDYWGITGTMDDESWRRLERECYYSADQILALIKEAGYVKLAEDQTMPPIPREDLIHIIMERDRILTQEGWRKVDESTP